MNKTMIIKNYDQTTNELDLSHFACTFYVKADGDIAQSPRRDALMSMQERLDSLPHWHGIANRVCCMDLMLGLANKKSPSFGSTFHTIGGVKGSITSYNLLDEDVFLYLAKNPVHGYPLPNKGPFLHLIPEGGLTDEIKEEIQQKDKLRKYPNTRHVFIELSKKEYNKAHKEAVSTLLDPISVYQAVCLSSADVESLKKRELKGLFCYRHLNEEADEEYHLCRESEWYSYQTDYGLNPDMLGFEAEERPGLTIHYIHIISDEDADRILVKKR